MAPQKKMTLQEFFSDQSFGGSWADDEIDMASISVPIEKHKQSLYSKDPFGNSHQSGGFGGHPYNRLSGLHDNGPPYIVKLLNLPVTSNEAFIEDLFKSRYTSYVKFKIVVDPASNILETHVIKKVAFVELESFQEMNKVLKWQDLYYKATRRVVVELADFHDFQHCISFNQEHEREILQIQDDFIKQKQSQHFGHGGFDHGPRNIHINSPPRRHQPLNSHANAILQPSLSGRKSTIHQESPAAPPAAAPPKNKPNPFGAAKPVDVLAKQHEIDKKLITINHTTIKTLGPMADDIDLGQHDRTGKQSSSESSHVPHERRPSQKDSRRTSVNILKRPSPSASQNVAPSNESKETRKPQLTKAPIPESIYAPKDNNKSLAELLNENENTSPPKGRSTPKSLKNSPKPSTSKPVILKKKTQTPTVDLTVKESEFASNTENAAANKVAEDQSQNKKINHESKEINDSLSQNNNQETTDKSSVNGSENPKETASDQNPSHETHSRPVETQAVPAPGDNKIVTEAQPSSSHEAERAKDRPNFKKHFAELSKKQNAQKDKVRTSQNTRFNSHSQTFNNRKNGVNYKRNSPRELGLSNEKEVVTSNQSTTSLENTTKSNVKRDTNKEERYVGVKTPGRNKNRFSARDKSTDLPKKELKKVEEVKSRRLPANLKANSKNGRKTKDTNNAELLETLNGSKEMSDAKDLKGRKNVQDAKDVKETKDKEGKPEVSSEVLNNPIISSKRSTKTPEILEKEVKSEPINGLTSSSTGGKQDISDSVNSIEDGTKSDTLSEKTSTTSSRGRGGRGGRGRGRGRGGFRGSIRGSRGPRGRGNFNLHYVRSKDDKHES